MTKEIENIERLINDKNVEFRDFKITSIETRKNDDDTESLVIEGVPCVFDTETVLYKGKYWEFREKIDKEAFKEADMTDVIFNYNHGGRVFARTRNNSLKLEVKSDGLHMKATLKKQDRGHEELYSDIQSGLVDKMSFAFTVKESKFEVIENKEGPSVEIRTITKVEKLYDVSAVDIPAYDSTSISARKAFNAESKEREAESLRIANDIAIAKAKYKYFGGM
jgi:HK97 family phage prohead protease